MEVQRNLIGKLDVLWIECPKCGSAGRYQLPLLVAQYLRDPNVDPIDWVERIPFAETRNYVERVIENLQVYRTRFAKGVRAEAAGLQRCRITKVLGKDHSLQSMQIPSMGLNSRCNRGAQHGSGFPLGSIPLAGARQPSGPTRSPILRTLRRGRSGIIQRGTIAFANSPQARRSVLSLEWGLSFDSLTMVGNQPKRFF